MGVDDVEEYAERITRGVVINETGRQFHLIHAQRFSDFVRQSLTREIVCIDQIDDAAIKIGLGWRVRNKSQTDKIVGRRNCTEFLAKVVDTLISDIIRTLKEYNRQSMLFRLIENIERAGIESAHWTRTSAALIGLHGDKAVERFVEQRSRYAGAGIASRVLAEIALCECPEGSGVDVADIELSKLIAGASLIVRLGGLSDAIFFNALPPEIAISPLGDILFRDEFGHIVVEPMLSRAIGERFVADAPRQKKIYSEPGYLKSVQGKLDDEFWSLWKEEMGFDLDQARQIIGSLEDEGIRRKSAIFEISTRDYFELACSEGVSESVAQAYLDQFSLSTRERWDRPPSGFLRKDIYPWKFGRRLSFVSRPILRFELTENPRLIISPESIRKSFAFVVDGTFHGSLDREFFKTDSMRNDWLVRAGEGHTFNNEVAQQLRDKKWEVRENIRLSELLNRKLDRDYGDIDVLAWNDSCRHVLVIECKNLSFARNYSEIASMLASYQGAEKRASRIN